jgi:uncharacterized protein (DUF1697 family)
MKYVALLRGINVGGNNIIKMMELKACFEKLGFANVASFIQSGNIIFESPVKNSIILVNKIEKALSKSFKYKSTVVLVSDKQLKQVVNGAPKGFGQNPAKYRYDVLFLRPSLSTKDALKQLSLKEGVDEAFAGKGVLYFSRLDSRATQSKLNRVASLPMYQEMTIRNWNTTTKLYALTEK